MNKTSSERIPAFQIKDIPIYGDVILAPMDGFTDYPFRKIARQFTSALTYSEFINGIDVVFGHPFLKQKLFFSDQERPFVYQIFDDNPDRLLKAAKTLEKHQPDIIDLNIGCSAKNVSNRGAGAGLLKDPQKIYLMLSSLVSTLKVPVTAKIRLGWDENSLNYLEVSRIVEESGASMIAVHGRTRSQEYSGTANWDAIAEIKQQVKIPVIGNGDVKTPADIHRMKLYTGCDAVMIGRAALGNPWILAGIEKESLPSDELYRVISDHLHEMTDFYGDHLGVILFRKHMARYLRNYLTTSEIRTAIFNLEYTQDILEMIKHLLSTYPISSCSNGENAIL